MPPPLRREHQGEGRITADVDPLDRAAEALGDRLRGAQLTPTIEGLELYLRNALSISLLYSHNSGLRDFDPQMG
ncbi:MAG: hypothetical protein ACOVOI_11495, partial [Hyphomicrobiales bacterium]